MKKLLILNFALALTLGAIGCLATGQVTLSEPVDIGPTTDTNISKYTVDLNALDPVTLEPENPDYVDNKDRILSVDEIAFVAIIENKAAAPAKARIYLSNDDTLDSVAEIENPKNATLIFDSPSIPGNSTQKIDWEDGFAYMENEDVVIDEVLGDGAFTLYGIAKNVPFNLEILGEVSVTITVDALE
jgi:hypothetical protein